MGVRDTGIRPDIVSGRPDENPHNYQDSIRVEEPPQQKQKAPQTTINKKPHNEKTPQGKPPQGKPAQRTQYKCMLNPNPPTTKPPQRKPLQTTIHKIPTMETTHNPH
jgi:hypothetical protein